MKKNKFMRLASGLLVGTLLTTCAISGTFAKYTTQDAAQDSARVAKWGVELQIIGDLYSDSYKDTSTDFVANEAVDTITVQTKAEADANLVAPGTKDDTGLTLKLTGTPEVDTEIIFDMAIENVFLAEGTYGIMVAVDKGIVTEDTFEDLDNEQPLYTEAGGRYTLATVYGADTQYYTLEDKIEFTGTYWPVVYDLDGSTSTQYDNTNGTGLDTLKDIATKIGVQLTGNNSFALTDAGDGNAATWSVADVTTVYHTNKDLADLNLSNINLKWDWNFTDHDNISNDPANDIYDGDDAAINDIDDCKDTILGNLQAGDVEVVKLDTDNTTFTNALVEGTDYNLETSFALDITVNQVD